MEIHVILLRRSENSMPLAELAGDALVQSDSWVDIGPSTE